MQLNITIPPAQVTALAQYLQDYYLSNHEFRYEIKDLEPAIGQWLLQSAESLMLDGHYHLVSGDCSYAFNRRGWIGLLNQLPCQEVNQAEPLAA